MKMDLLRNYLLLRCKWKISIIYKKIFLTHIDEAPVEQLKQGEINKFGEVG